MFLSKIWFILIALVSAVAATFALVAPKPAVRNLEALEKQRLDRAQYAAEQMFKVDAHKRIDLVAKLGRDAILSESLDAASRGSGEYAVIHRTIGDRLRTLIPDLATGGIDEIVALDNKGRVIARVGGDNEKEYGDFIGGVEVVADALRGYLSDDAWGVGGKLERVAGAPVLSKSKDRIVGAVYVAAETGPSLVERLKKNLDVDTALLLRGKVVAASRPIGDLDGLPELVAQHTGEIAELKRTPALPLAVGSETLLVVAAPFPGQAGEQQGYYAVLGVQPPVRTDLSALRALLTNVSSNDLRWGSFPWVPLSIVTFAMIAGGLLLQRLEVEAPVAKLRRELQKLAAGDIQKIDDLKYGGKYGGLARDVNAAVERFTHAPGARSEMAGKDLNAILGPSGGSTFDLPAAGSAFSGSDPAPAFAPPAAPAFAPPPAPAFPPPPPGGFAPPPLPSFNPPPAAAFSAPALPQPFSAASLGGASLPPAIKPAPWSQPQQLPTGALDDDGANASADRQMPDGEATRVVPYDLQEEEDAHFRHVFDDFVETKRSCGEPTAGLTQAKFLQKLRDNKSALVAKHGCRTVRFSVYVKDGKAALRATPIRE
ncbi:MAG TPA: MXAN_5187 family protein [Polyangia bacterium]